jgi:cytochrome c nitrite reductase small subunit
MAVNFHARTVQVTALGMAVGFVIGLGAYTFIYAKGGSYLTDNPAACANCHIMQEQYDGWIKSSHRAVATCNDCHTPHSFFAKYYTKAENGFWHSWAFTTGWHPEPIRARPVSRAITQKNCRHCHADIVHAIDHDPGPDRQLDCIRCHREVGHPK